MKLNRRAYEGLIAEDIEWLMQQPRTLEREHILAVLRASADHEYRPKEAPLVNGCCEPALLDAGKGPSSGRNGHNDKWTCPVCGDKWVYIEDEAEGGYWIPVEELSR